HVALDLELAGHVGGRRVLLAAHDLLERLLRRRDRAVRAVAALRDGDRAVVDVDLPRARAFDLEHVRVAHARRLRRIDPLLEPVEELPDAVSHLASSARMTARAYRTASLIDRSIGRASSVAFHQPRPPITDHVSPVKWVSIARPMDVALASAAPADVAADVLALAATTATPPGGLPDALTERLA